MPNENLMGKRHIQGSYAAFGGTFPPPEPIARRVLQVATYGCLPRGNNHANIIVAKGAMIAQLVASTAMLPCMSEKLQLQVACLKGRHGVQCDREADMLDFESIGKTIHDLRVEHGYSQDSLAELLGVSHQAVSRWELGMTVPTVDNLVELCDLFEVNFEQLLCLNRKACFDERDIFKGHSRMFVLKQIIKGKLNFDVAANFNIFFPQERLMLLRAVKEGKLTVNKFVLYDKLTNEERRLLGGAK